MDTVVALVVFELMLLLAFLLPFGSIPMSLSGSWSFTGVVVFIMSMMRVHAAQGLCVDLLTVKE